MSATIDAVQKHKPTFALIAVLCAGLIAWNAILNFVDQNFPGAPWITATVEIVPPPPNGDAPRLRYRPVARMASAGRWTAIIYTGSPERFTRYSTTTGPGTYIPRREEKVWRWDAFFEGNDGRGVPVVPDGPFMVCVTYDVEAVRSGARWITPGDYDNCSGWYDPQAPEGSL